MARPIRILHIEDDLNDAELIASFMSAEGLSFDIFRIDSREEFLSALEECSYDVILADFSLPSFDGFSALRIAAEKCPDIPFIFVSGAIGEEMAVDMLKMGATDYVLKDRLSRLVPAIQRALKEADQKAKNKRLEEQLIHAQKMEAVGQFAGGIAHDFNNILTVIKGFASILVEELDGPKGPLKDDIKRIISAAEKGSDLVRDLLAFSSRRKFEPVETDLNGIIKKSESFISKVLKKSMSLRINLVSEDLTVRADSRQIEHCLINLAANARDAMAEGGVLTIETSRSELDEEFIASYAFGKPGPYALISVRDTGTGIDEETRKSIFDPFFTTKEIGKGTGLGLSIVYQIIKQHKGYVNVCSEAGKGTTFLIYLPLVEETGQIPLRQRFNHPPAANF